jgi:hypothetical protein
VEESVEILMLPHVIQVVMGSFQPDTEALDTLRWLDETFELVGWIEERSTRLLGKVIVDNLVYSSEGEGAITIQRSEDGGELPTGGRVQRLFYLRNV